MIDKKIVDYIKELSKSDKKALSQKTLKAVEELGELSKAVLPYEHAWGTTHRFIDHKKIIEEISDTILCLLSIGYEIGMTDEDLNQMLLDKSKIWSQKQIESGITQKDLPYEIHITIENGEVEKFKEVCNKIGVKPLLLHLHMKQDIANDLQTSSVCLGNNKSAYLESMRIKDELTKNGFQVIRVKIETVPWHPAAPNKTNNYDMPENCYFETHMAVKLNLVDVLQNENPLIQILKETAAYHNARLSRNAFKIDDNHMIMMVTYRNYDGLYENFLAEKDFLFNQLLTKGFEVEKSIVEFSIYDTKISHDNKWIMNE